MTDRPFEEVVRPEELEAVRAILQIAVDAGAGDESPAKSVMAILASSYTTAAGALLMAGCPPDEVERAVRADYELCLRMLKDTERGRFES